MKTDKELIQQALEALDAYSWEQVQSATAALRERLAQPEQPNDFNPDWDAMAVMVEEQQRMAKRIEELEARPEQEFIKHHGDDEGWSEWVCPDPDGYLMKCCDCGLVHEAEFGVVRYKSETEQEDCDRVDDPNLQAVFRMRRSEQWSPEDTAHRAGGMPMAQPEQEPVAWRWKERINGDFDSWVISASEPPPYAIEQQPLYTTPSQRKPLTEPELHAITPTWPAPGPEWGYEEVLAFVRAIEAAHGIGEKPDAA